ncbi:hypothetical protein [Oscillibacter hominis]|nr:hypothetical protein [Oscillibacter hominis]
MKRRLAPEEKQELVARYQMGEPVKLSFCGGTKTGARFHFSQ